MSLSSWVFLMKFCIRRVRIMQLQMPYLEPLMVTLWDSILKSYEQDSALQDLKLQLGISQSLTTIYHPQSDGESEVLNRCLQHYLRAMTRQWPKEWVNWLPLYEWWYNTTYHSVIQTTPFEIVYGQAPSLHLPYFPQSTKVEEVDRSFIVRE
ncbi:unnamed protein product [Vicia faba]|uniref:Integrase catalytic domain-containing protein n=1 Tax=Vicia faba TaxID=3906 RepID=A0AAV1ANR8_VICFA|nr:unnamed protein product [Vicia faba]